MYKYKQWHLIILFILCSGFPLFAQQSKEREDLGDKEYIIVKDYRPVLAESQKISDLPDGDTTTFVPPVQDYNLRASQTETSFETSSIKAVKVKDEPLSKLYRNLVKLGLGNYSKYNGEIYVNSLRSKKGALGFSGKHLSASPVLKNSGNGAYSQNTANLFGRYFLENATFSGDFLYDRDVVHYYGFDSRDTIIDKKDTEQRFSSLGFNLGIGSNHLEKGKLDYKASFGFNTTSDKYGVNESDFLVKAGAGKLFGDKYVKLDATFNYFKKSRADFELLSLNSNLNRSIVRIEPSLIFNKDKVRFELGGRMVIEKNLDTDVHLYPNFSIYVPIAENVVSVFAKAEGDLKKNSFRTLTEENPFLTPAIRPFNTNEALALSGGLTGNFSSTVSFTAAVKYSTVKDMVLFVNDSLQSNLFDFIFADANVLNLHAELAYQAGEKLNISLHFDQFNYSVDLQEQAWHQPNNLISLVGRYNLQDKILVKAALYARGKSYAREATPSGYKSIKIDSYVDGNVGLEYRYSKILSIYLNLNNVGFSNYQRWYNYPTEKLNVLGGITYSF